jgi:hypothetical protein
MPLQATSGAASYDAFGGGVPVVPAYIEEVFSTYLYTGNGSTQTITNGIDLSGKGGLTWIKSRSSANSGVTFDTARGATKLLFTISTGAEGTYANTLTSFNSNGFSLGSDSTLGVVNVSNDTYASWTFRKQPKFFDVLTYTGTGSTQTIAHNLGSVPGSIIVKAISGGATNWAVYHRSLGGTGALLLNSTSDTLVSSDFWNNTDPTSTVFTVKNSSATNSNGVSYVAYLFAHNAGGFGLTSTDNVISCGSWYNSGSAPVNVTLGYEPQFILFKNADAAGQWFMLDTMRGDSLTSQSYVKANSSDAESTNVGAPGYPAPTATGFTSYLGSEGTHIYIAIRRGPMKVPTVGTSVFAPVINTGNDSATTITSNFPVDLAFRTTRNVGIGKSEWDRLRGSVVLETNTTAAESSNSSITLDNSTGINVAAGFNGTYNFANWLFRRAPSFFDEVCYTGTGSATTFNHNLGVVPEMMIVKRRTSSSGINWSCYHSALGNTQVISLNEDIQAYTASQWNNTTPTSTVFSVGTQGNVNASGQTYVAYLFATCAGVSKVGSYTGTGTTLQINCGFTAGSRFVLIKRTDEVASGNPWYVWDSARGIVSGNDPYLLLNSSAAEVTNTDYIDTYSAGFEISSTAPSAINASGGTFIFLAIA